MANDEDAQVALIKKTVFWAVFLLVLLIAGCSTMYTVPAGERGIITTFGKPTSVQEAGGLYFKAPIVQDIIPVNIQQQKYEANAISAASKDLQLVLLNVTINYQLEPASVIDLYTTIGLNYENKIIAPAVQAIAKKNSAKFTAQELVERRPELQDNIENDIRTTFEGTPFTILRVFVTDIDYSDSFNTAIEAAVVAKQKKVQAENELGRIMIEANQTIAVAEGQKAAAIAKAQAEAQTINLVNQELTRSPNYIKYIQAQAMLKWDGKLPQYTGGYIPLMNVNDLLSSSSQISSLSGGGGV